jgi:hypothetical protein
MTLPIITVHRSNAKYLGICLLQARRSNPESRVILLGDGANDCHPAAEHFDCGGLSRSAQAFSSVYKHLSLSPFGFELFCIQRWFIISEFMRERAIEAAFVQDSDVMLFGKVGENRPAEAAMAFCGNSGHVAYVTRAGLEHFCQYIMDYYTEPERMARLVSIFGAYRAKHRSGGICDMTLIHHYRREHPKMVSDLSTHNAATAFDNNINSPDGYASWCGMKRIYFADGEAVAYRDRRPVRFAAVHFQGRAKFLMASAYRGDTAMFALISCWLATRSRSIALLSRAMRPVKEFAHHALSRTPAAHRSDIK